MSTDAISPLRQRMIEDMSARKLNPHTQRIHISSCKRFAAYLKRSPDTATADEIRLFQLHLTETGASICNRNRIMTGLRFLFRVTLRRLDLAAEIFHIKEPQKIPARVFPNCVCITSPGGSQAATKADWSPLVGRRVLVWPDADEPGAKYAATVAGNLHGQERHGVDH
jgi:hypothetical protein